MTNKKDIKKREEIWKDIKGWEGYYQISNLGRVKSLSRIYSKTELILCSHLRNGYPSIMLARFLDKKNYSIHRILALEFIPNPENKPCINHINGIRTDNRVENLEWCTFQENSDHALKMGWMGGGGAKGESHPKSKLIDKQVLEIRRLHKEGVRQIELAKMFGVGDGAISKIVNKTLWKHI